jgi:hypothetical protein
MVPGPACSVHRTTTSVIQKSPEFDTDYLFRCFQSSSTTRGDLQDPATARPSVRLASSQPGSRMTAVYSRSVKNGDPCRSASNPRGHAHILSALMASFQLAATAVTAFLSATGYREAAVNRLNLRADGLYFCINTQRCHMRSRAGQSII